MQERWMASDVERLRSALIGVGAAFDSRSERKRGRRTKSS